MKLLPITRSLLIFALVIVGLRPNILRGQDPVFTQFFAQKMYLNPALTGYDGGASASISTRDQWRRIGGTNAIFRTNNAEASLDLPMMKSAFGLQMFSNEMGNSPDQSLLWQKVGLSYAFRNRSCNPYRDPNWEMSLGLRLSYNRYRLNFDGFTFASQLNPITGFDPNAANPLANFNNGIGQDEYLDLDAGIAFRFRNIGFAGSPDDHLLIGLAVSHLPSRSSTLLSLGGQQALRFTFHSSYVIHLGGSGMRYQLVPMIRSDMQYASGWAQGGSYKYWSNQVGAVANMANNSQFWFGVWGNGRVVPNPTNDDVTNVSSIYSASMGLGTDLPLGGNGAPRIKLGISMDYNVTGTLSDGGKTVEFFAVFHWPNATNCKCFTPFM